MTVRVELPPADLDGLVREHENDGLSFDAAAREAAEQTWSREQFQRNARGESIGERPPDAEFGREGERIAGAVKAYRQGLREDGAALLADRPNRPDAKVPERRAPGREPEGVLITGMLRRGAVSIMPGATHVGKTILAHAMLAAGVAGREFLGRPVSAQRWLVVDAENNADDLYDLWIAHGLAPEAIAEHVRVIDQTMVYDHDVTLAADGAGYLLDQARAHRADAIVLDSLGMLAGVNLRDDEQVAALYREQVKPLAVKARAAVLLPHHETKYGRAGGDKAYQGSGQVTAQADYVLTVRQTAKLKQSPVGDTRSTLALRQSKARPRGTYWTEHVEVRGRVGGTEDGAALESLTVRKIGADQVTDLDTFMAALYEPTSPGALADRLGWSRRGERFRDAAKAAEEAGRMVREGATSATVLVPVELSP